MYRKGRLSVKRKNEVRRRTLDRGGGECESESDHSHQQLTMSIHQSILLTAPVLSVDHLQQRLKNLSCLPQGIYNVMYM